MLKIRRPLGRLIFNMGIAIPGKTVFLIETAPWLLIYNICFVKSQPLCTMLSFFLLFLCSLTHIQTWKSAASLRKLLSKLQELPFLVVVVMMDNIDLLLRLLFVNRSHWLTLINDDDYRSLFCTIDRFYKLWQHWLWWIIGNYQFVTYLSHILIARVNIDIWWWL